MTIKDKPAQPEDAGISQLAGGVKSHSCWPRIATVPPHWLGLKPTRKHYEARHSSSGMVGYPQFKPCQLAVYCNANFATTKREPSASIELPLWWWNVFTAWSAPARCWLPLHFHDTTACMALAEGFPWLQRESPPAVVMERLQPEDLPGEEMSKSSEYSAENASDEKRSEGNSHGALSNDLMSIISVILYCMGHTFRTALYMRARLT